MKIFVVGLIVDIVQKYHKGKMKNSKAFLMIAVSASWLFAGTLYAQSSKKYNYSVELGGYYSINNKIPFWLQSNQFGAVPAEGNTVMFRQSLESKIDTSTKFFKGNYCADVVLIVGSEAKIIIPEAFYKLNFGSFALMAGRKKQVHGLVDSTLSSGSVTWSGNSLPLPEIQFSIPEYRKLFFNFLAVKGHFSHGWFGKQTFVNDYYLHQKSLYMRVGKPTSKLKLYGGILHHAQWGGTPKFSVPVEDPRYIEGKFASDWYTYKNIVFPLPNLSADSLKGYSQYDYENRFGNHLGQLDMGGTLNLKKVNILAYKQIIFETGQTFSSLTNIDDGLYGLSFKFKKQKAIVKKVVIEVLHTTNQGRYRAGFLQLVGFYGKHFGETSNFYFNHGQYIDGWAYNKMTIGSPFLISNDRIRNEKAENRDQVFANNNRIKALYLGFDTQLNTVRLESRFSFSRNLGSDRVKFGTADQLSIGFKAAIPAPKLKGVINFSVGIEQGDLIYDNYGVFLSFKRLWN